MPDPDPFDYSAATAIKLANDLLTCPTPDQAAFAARTYPWLALLSPADIKEFISEFSPLVFACLASENFLDLSLFLRQWSYTASLHRDEDDLIEDLAKPIPEDAITSLPIQPPTS